MNIHSVLRGCKWYFFILLILLLAASFMLMINGKAASFISLNSYHPFLLNVFFINYTFLGDGIFALCLTVIFFFYFKRNQQASALLLSFLISGLAAQIIKNLVYSPRPHIYFEPGQYLYFIDGVILANHSSFPSGHTATAFAIATVLVMMMKNKNLQLLVLLAAVLVGYSRIYLAQHFLLDVIAGSFIGSASGILSVYLSLNINDIRRSIRNLKPMPGKEKSTSPQEVQAA